ncbi:hypothetical protein [Halodesulfurarchaeum sp.]|uniref:hypothetical protein n=1 Tax=Halodesulfurarchaeum sp. TaxID=1980530 RepID=UPI002FC2E8D4
MRRHDRLHSHAPHADGPRPAPPLRRSLAMAVAIPLMATFLLSPAGPVFLLGLAALSLAAIGL